MEKTLRNKIYFYVASCLAMFVFVPGRFAFGIMILAEFNFLMFATISTSYLIKMTNLEELKNVLFPVSLIFYTILFKQILILINPLIALTLGYCIYLPALSATIFEIFFKEELDDYQEDLKNGMKKSIIFTLIGIIVFTIRDILGFGTFTLPLIDDIKYFYIPYDLSSPSAAAFIASIPGSFALVSLMIVIYIIFNEKYMKLKHKNIQDEDEGENDDKYNSILCFF